MPGHKGNFLLGCEALDITEIHGADVLYSASGIIEESELNATELFGTAHTFYSTEGSTLAIKAMLAIIKSLSPNNAKILAARNVHKAFVYACGLLDLDVEWLFSEKDSHLCDCEITPDSLRKKLEGSESLPTALYVTSPTYLGKTLDISGLSAVCKEYGIYLLVDNAHGAYLAFRAPSEHPIALGADLCCDSAHKTLPTLTGGAYLHVSKSFAPYDESFTRNALSIFASTSPSYLILQSLDLTNAYLANGFAEKLSAIEGKIATLKSELAKKGFVCEPSETLKLVLGSQGCGYTGEELAERLRGFNVEAEYADRDTLTLMLSTESSELDIERVLSAFKGISPKAVTDGSAPILTAPKRVKSIREALFSQSERISVKDSLGRVCASPSVSCPPAIPPVVSGERIDEKTIEILSYYGINEIDVVR